MNIFNETNKNSKLLTVFAIIFSIAFTFITFFTFSNTVNADYVEPYATGETYTLTGTFVLNNTLTSLPFEIEEVQFTCNGVVYSYFVNFGGSDLAYNLTGSPGDNLVVYDYRNNTWTNEIYKTITFDNQDVSENFYNWVMSNEYVEPQPPIIEQIIDLLVGGINTIASGVGVGLSTLATSIFLNEVGTLSTFGILVIVFGGIALAIGLCRFIVKWLTKFGN